MFSLETYSQKFWTCKHALMLFGWAFLVGDVEMEGSMGTNLSSDDEFLLTTSQSIVSVQGLTWGSGVTI